MIFETFARQVIGDLPIRAKTRSTYLSMVNCHVTPSLGKLSIESITRSDIQGSLRGLPPQTAAMTLAVIKSVYREAQARGVVDSSPAHGISGPKIMVSPRKFLTWEEVKYGDFGQYTDCIRFFALHGLRWSEALALSQEDIRDGRIYVSKSVHGQTKSRAGIRTVPLMCELPQFPTSPKTLRKVLKPYGVTIHSLRHSYAYLLKQQGVHVTTAQRLLGHSDPRITMGIYTQVLDNEIDEAGFILAKAI
jgi:integrase